MNERCPAIGLLTWLIVFAAAAMGWNSRLLAEEKPVRVLMVTGVDYEGHHWKETAPVLRTILEKDARLAVREIDDLEFLSSPVIFDYDVILLHLKNYDPPRRPEEVHTNLTRFVSQGRGLVLVHFACGAFEDWKGYVELAGRVWDKSKRAHDPRGPFEVKVVDRQHPITRGLKDFQADDELYTCLGGDRSIQVLATARSKVDGKEYPMAFVRQVGQGRTFQTVLGHDVKAFSVPGLDRMLQRACLWAGGRELD